MNRPTEPGWYWCRYNGKVRVALVAVGEDHDGRPRADGRLVVVFTWWAEWEFLDDLDFIADLQWGPPIGPPPGWES